MVGIVLVSHSRALALAVRELVLSMTGGKLALALAAGVGDDRRELGTDAIEISEAIHSVHGPDGVLVLMDMGSAILSAETALDLLDESVRDRVLFCAAPFVEGAVAAGVTASMGAPIQQVKAEALKSLQAKQTSLPEPETARTVSAPAPIPSVEIPSTAKTIRLTVPNRHGLHARPIARLISEMAPFSSHLTIRNLNNLRGPISLKSLSAVATLEILHGHEVEVTAAGPDAPAALARVRELVASGLGDDLAHEAATPRIEPPGSPTTGLSRRPTPVSPGLVIGPVHRLGAVAFTIPENKVADPKAESQRLRAALNQVHDDLSARAARMSQSTGPSSQIYEAQLLALQDPDLVSTALEAISRERANAARAWSCATDQIVGRYADLTDPYLRERGSDYRDVGAQVLAVLGAAPAQPQQMTTPAILVADDLTPGEVSDLNPKLVLGVVLLKGGPTAHSSILLKALGLPTLVQAERTFGTAVPSVVAFDGATGELWLDPPPAKLEELRLLQKEASRQAEKAAEKSREPALTADGHHIHILANIGQVSDAANAAAAGAEGVGLLRTEFLFLDRNQAPSEEEQFEAMRTVASSFPGMPIVVRTLDIGGDKGVPYLAQEKEANPFLGVRALRLCFARPELFVTQLRATLRAGHGTCCRVMFPMVADRGDLLRARTILDEVHAALAAEKIPHAWPIEVGIMIEIPSAALQAEALAQEADFFSIGTNDLTQYTLAVDRGNPELLPYQDAVHPAVLKLIQEVVCGAAKHNRQVAVCGEVAADEFAAGLLVGLGVNELSVSASAIPQLKASLRKQRISRLRDLAKRALACQTAAEVRELARET